MEQAAQELTIKTRKILITQLFIAALVAAGFFITKGMWEVRSSLYGAAVSIAVVMLLGRGVARAAADTTRSSSRVMALLYVGAAIRFVLVLVLIAVGITYFEFEALAIIVGFILTQAGYLFNLQR